MRPPRVRLTVRGTMAFVAFVGLLLGWAVYRERLRRQIYRLINQDILVSAVEAKYRNAGLAWDAAEAAITRYSRERGGGDESPTFTELRATARKARLKELALEQTWGEEKQTLSRLIREHYDSW
jgi:hypothetical protein